MAYKMLQYKAAEKFYNTCGWYCAITDLIAQAR